MGNKIKKPKDRTVSHVLPNDQNVSTTSVSSINQAITTTLSQASQLPDVVTIVWLDARAESSSSHDCSIKRMLRRIQSSVVIFDNVKKCQDFLNTISNKSSRIFLIVSGKLSTCILSDIKNLLVIDSVFIFCACPERYEHLVNRYSPYVVGVFTQEHTLQKSLEIELKHYHMRVPVFNFFAQKQNVIRDLTYDAASFLWFQLLQKVLMDAQFDKNDMEEMLDYCYKHYARNDQQQKFSRDIDEFRMTYESTDAIKWYTRQTFVYKLINAALRTEDIDALYIFRFYISDLCRQLANEHNEFRLHHQQLSTLKFYRGCHMTTEELDKLQDSLGDMISINGFISTTEEKSIADKFLSHMSQRGADVQKVLWIIEVEASTNGIVFAPIAEYSQHPEEKEVLFNIGSAFRIDKVTFNEIECVFYVEATATNAGSYVVSEYMKLIKQELDQTNEKVIFGTLLIDMGKYVTAQRYFDNLIHRSNGNNLSELAAFHYNLGLTYRFQRDLHLAERHFREALEHQKSIPSHQHDVVRILNALGWVYQDNGELSMAIKLYKEAEVICDTNLGHNNLANAQTYAYIGRYYLQRQEYIESTKYYQYALDILDLHSLKHHQRYGIILNEIGDVKRKSGDSEEAFKLYQQAEVIFRDILPEHHPCMAYCWSVMGLVSLQIKDLEQAQYYHEKALKSYKRVLPFNHINISISEKNLKCTNYNYIIDSYLQVCSQV